MPHVIMTTVQIVRNSHTSQRIYCVTHVFRDSRMQASSRKNKPHMYSVWFNWFVTHSYRRVRGQITAASWHMSDSQCVTHIVRASCSSWITLADEFVDRHGCKLTCLMYSWLVVCDSHSYELIVELSCIIHSRLIVRDSHSSWLMWFVTHSYRRVRGQTWPQADMPHVPVTNSSGLT